MRPALARLWPISGFTHGVASGHPGPGAVTLWTRYASVTGTATSLKLEVAEDQGMTRIIARAEANAGPESWGTAQARVTGLPDGKWLWYRFTAPDGSMSQDAVRRVQGALLAKAYGDPALVSKLIEAADKTTDRVHTSYQLAAATTGRLASSDPNLQNIPIRTETGRQIRQAFIAAPGHVLISADYSQIELRLLAHIGDIPELKRAFAAGIDIHTATASEMFGVPVDQMDPETRRRAKAINFGIVYGISAFGLANQLGIDQGEAGAYIKTYFERFPGIRTYMDRTKAEVRQAGFVSTVFGRRIHIPAIHSKSGAERQFGERAAINAPIQGAAADIIRRAMIRMPAALAEAGLKTRMLLQVHDELVFEAPEAEAERAIPVIKRVMETASDPAVALTVPLVVDARAAPNWDEAH